MRGSYPCAVVTDDHVVRLLFPSLDVAYVGSRFVEKDSDRFGRAHCFRRSDVHCHVVRAEYPFWESQPDYRRCIVLL